MRQPVAVIATALAYALAAYTGYAYLQTHEGFATVWPAAGIAWAALLLSPRRWWPAMLLGVVAGKTAAVLATEGVPAVAVVIGGVDAAHALAGAYVLRPRLTGGRKFESIDDVVALTLAALLISALAAGLAGVIVASARDGGAATTAAIWFVSRTLGVVIVTPALLVWQRPKQDGPPSPAPWAAAGVLALVVVLTYTAYQEHTSPDTFATLRYALIPILAWISSRFGMRLLTAAISLFGVTALWATAGYHAGETANLHLWEVIDLQIFVGIAAVTAYAFSSVAEARGQQRRRFARENRLLEQLLENSPSGIIILDPEGALVFANNQAQDLLGLARQDLLTRRFDTPEWRITTPAGAPANPEQLPFALVRRTGAPVFDVRHAVERADGARILLSVNAGPVFDDRGAIVNVVAIFRDITEAESQAEATRRAREELEVMFELIPDLVAVADKTHFLRLNSAWERTLGFTRRELLDQPFSAFVHEGDHDALTPLHETGRTANTLLTRLRTKTGEIRHVEWSLRGDGDIWYGIARDVTDRVAAERDKAVVEQRIRDMQKMEAVGRLAGGVAHDFNNLLTTILGLSKSLRSAVADDREAGEAARAIELAAERAASLTSQLLGFARRGKFQDVPVDLHAQIESIAAMAGRTFDKRIAVDVRLEATRAVVQGDPGQLVQVFLNLAINARDAMPEGGTLSFVTRDGVGPDGDVTVVLVSDTGHGIAADLLPRIFEPYFTTKGELGGSGMGLAMVYGIVKNHGGTIQVTSVPGEGTTFEPVFPAVQADLGETGLPATSAPPSAAPATASVLVIDDEPLVAFAIRHMLESFGYRVDVAADAERGVALYAAHSHDAVVLDLSMPGLDGGAAFRRLREIDPAVRVLLTSGYAIDGRVQGLIDEGVKAFLQKPFEPAQLSAALTRVLAPA